MTKRNELIEAIRNQPADERPFVCSGFPDECDVVVIGENPATKLRAPWNRFWSETAGFDFGAFLANYKSERIAKGKRDEISATRLRLEKLRELGIRCLETNVYSNENQHGAGIARSENALLPLLLQQNAAWRAIIVHGSKAREFFEKSKLPLPMPPIYTKHLSRVSYEVVERLAHDIVAGNSREWSR
jgi:hypothetical protein